LKRRPQEGEKAGRESQRAVKFDVVAASLPILGCANLMAGDFKNEPSV
jgi:hypothetical protein